MKKQVNELLNRLFPGQKKVAEREPLTRTDRDDKAYQKWEMNEASKELLSLIHKSYHFKKAGISAPLDMQIYEGDGSNGFAILAGMGGLEATQLPFVLRYFSESVMRLGYKLAHSDREISEKDHFVETRERIYLKPPLSLEQPMEQLYGNVLLELIYADRKAQYLKLMANTYTGHSYAPALAFDQLMELLFD